MFFEKYNVFDLWRACFDSFNSIITGFRYRNIILCFSDELSKKTSNKILDNLVMGIEKNAEEHGLENHDFLDQLQKRCLMKWGPAPVQEKDKSPTEYERIIAALAVIYLLDLSSNQYQVKILLRYI